jgi:hypothetical protein
MVSVYEAAGMVGDGPRCGVCTATLTRTETESGRVVCLLCEEKVLRSLTAIEALWKQLPDWTEKGTARAGGGRGGSTGSAAPGNLAAISLLAGEVWDRLVAWEDNWRLTRRWGPAVPRGGHDERLAGVIRFLRDELPWAVRTDADAVEGLLTDCRRLVGEMRDVVNPGPATRMRTQLLCPRPVGARTETGDGHSDNPDGGDNPEGEEGGETRTVVETCGGQLVVDMVRVEIRCRVCSTAAPRSQWRELAQALGNTPAAEVEAA